MSVLVQALAAKLRQHQERIERDRKAIEIAGRSGIERRKRGDNWGFGDFSEAWIANNKGGHRER